MRFRNRSLKLPNIFQEEAKTKAEEAKAKAEEAKTKAEAEKAKAEEAKTKAEAEKAEKAKKDVSDELHWNKIQLHRF